MHFVHQGIKCQRRKSSDNIHINDLFYFVNETELANYADDNTPYAIDIDTDSVINTLENDADILITWFRDNYMKLNEDKCHFLITDTTEKMSMYVISPGGAVSIPRGVQRPSPWKLFRILHLQTSGKRHSWHSAFLDFQRSERIFLSFFPMRSCKYHLFPGLGPQIILRYPELKIKLYKIGFK